MSFIDNIVRSNTYKNFMSKLYGWGAAVVIIGALFKINHWQGGELMLIIGMGTETLIFFLSAFEPPHVEFDWTLVYPQLAGMEGGEGLNAKSDAFDNLDNLATVLQILIQFRAGRHQTAIGYSVKVLMDV